MDFTGNNLKSVSNNSSNLNLVTDHYKSSELISENKFSNTPLGLFFGGIVVWFLDSIQVIFIALAIFIVFHLFIASPHTIDGPSMEPNFCQNDLILADKLTPNFNNYDYKDVIIFKYDAENDYIKRVIGKGGDRIKIQEGKVYRNGAKIDEPYLPQGTSTTIYSGARMAEGQEYLVPDGKYFVLGDNRDRSIDSRSFLAIDPKVNIIKGRIVALIWPARDARVFKVDENRPLSSCER